MVKEVFLNNRLLHVDQYFDALIEDLHRIHIEFKVTSEDYHEVAMLLYEGTFDVQVPERRLSFRGTIHHYSTSVTNLYEKGQVAVYKLTIMEVQD